MKTSNQEEEYDQQVDIKKKKERKTVHQSDIM